MAEVLPVQEENVKVVSAENSSEEPEKVAEEEQVDQQRTAESEDNQVVVQDVEPQSESIVSSEAGKPNPEMAVIIDATNPTMNGDGDGEEPRQPEETPTSKARRRAKALEQASMLAEKSERAYESSIWCFMPRFILRFPKNWPRVSAFFFGLVLPLWLLIFIAAGFGVLLAGYESGTEIEGNDAILAARARIRFLDVENIAFLRLPTICTEQYFEDGQKGVNNVTTFESRLELAAIAGGNYTIEDAANDTRQEMEDYMTECSESYAPSWNLAVEVRKNTSEAFESLSFNWNRCWNYSVIEEDSKFIFHPSDELIAVSRPDAQEETYSNEWKAVQAEFYLQYLPPNATDEERRDALDRSIAEATGDNTCHNNVIATAWFFFTIMTTVGYGNQAPVTYEGRMLVYTAGLTSVVLFGAVLGTSGYILLAIFNDFVSRSWLSKFLKIPWIGVLLWGSIWLIWSTIIATDAQWWWENRLPDFQLETPNDPIWFAFISTTTIGLGDYFLQPEVIFASDALKFSVTYLIGFVFLSTFFGKVVESVNAILPARENSLETRLKATRVLFCWEPGFFCRLMKKPTTTTSNDGNDEEKGEYDEAGQEISPPLDATQTRERIEALQAFLEAGCDEEPTNLLVDDHDKDDDDHDKQDEGSTSSLMSSADSTDLSSLIDKEEAVLRELLTQVQAKRQLLEDTTAVRIPSPLDALGETPSSDQIDFFLAEAPSSDQADVSFLADSELEANSELEVNSELEARSELEANSESEETPVVHA